jgi:hypothetical protein
MQETSEFRVLTKWMLNDGVCATRKGAPSRRDRATLGHRRDPRRTEAVATKTGPAQNARTRPACLYADLRRGGEGRLERRSRRYEPQNDPPKTTAAPTAAVLSAIFAYQLLMIPPSAMLTTSACCHTSNPSRRITRACGRALAS